jgi:hypothetical protein
MRIFLCVVIALLFHSPAALAQEKASSGDIQFPAEYKSFFDDLSALMKKYPAAAKRFGMFDKKNPSSPRTPDSLPVIQSALCSATGGTCCTKWINEGNWRCVQCEVCLQ